MNSNVSPQIFQNHTVKVPASNGIQDQKRCVSTHMIGLRCPISLWEAIIGFFPIAFRIFSGSRSFTMLNVDTVFVDFSMLVLFLSRDMFDAFSMFGLSYFVLLDFLIPYSCLCSLLLLLLTLTFGFVQLSLERDFSDFLWLCTELELTIVLMFSCSVLRLLLIMALLSDLTSFPLNIGSDLHLTSCLS